MKTAADWAHLRQGVLSSVPAEGSFEDFARSSTFEKFVQLVQEDAISNPPMTVYRPAPPGTPLEALVDAVERFRKEGLKGLLELQCAYCGLDGCTGLSDQGRSVHAPVQKENGGWTERSGCIERAVDGKPSAQ